jgi:hypothetical protein
MSKQDRDKTKRKRQPDIVLILTDDQRWDTLWAMPTVRRLLIDRGVLFTRGYVVNPVCCPSRATSRSAKGDGDGYGYSRSQGGWDEDVKGNQRRGNDELGGPPPGP